MVIIHTGNGKGKTTAAIGQAIRALGQGKRVVMLQFIKSVKYPSGEERAVKKFGKAFQIIKGGKGFVGILGDTLPRATHADAAQRTLARAKKIIHNTQCDILILDEIFVALYLKLISSKDVCDLLAILPKTMHFILTGRNAPKTFIHRADLVTIFQEHAHPFRKGAQAMRGIEF